MLRAGVFSPCPFQRHGVGDGLSPVASLTKVHELRVALFNSCFLHNRGAMLTALSFMEQTTWSRAFPPQFFYPPFHPLTCSFLSPRLLAVFRFCPLTAWEIDMRYHTHMMRWEDVLFQLKPGFNRKCASFTLIADANKCTQFTCASKSEREENNLD